jgi:simple sugar transport system permease protein
MMFAALGFAPLPALYSYFVAPLTSWFDWGELFLKATPLALIATGLAFGFRAGVWNIGAEGQLILGAIGGAAAALSLPALPGGLGAVLALIAGMAAGALLAAIPAVLRVRFATNEILVSLMLTYIATQLLSYLVHGPMRDPFSFGFPQSAPIPAHASLPPLISGVRMNLMTPLAVILLGLAWLLISRTVLGFGLRLKGTAPAAARFAGVGDRRLVLFTLLVGGAIAGLVGAAEVIGPISQLQPQISPGYGFTAIIVAFLGQLHPIGIALAALLVALTYLGAEAVQIRLGIPLAVAGVIQGVLLFTLLAFEILGRYRVRWQFGPPTPETVHPSSGAQE